MGGSCQPKRRARWNRLVRRSRSSPIAGHYAWLPPGSSATQQGIELSGRSGRCCVSSTVRPPDDIGSNLPRVSSCDARQPSPACAAASRPTTFVTPTRSRWPTRRAAGRRHPAPALDTVHSRSAPVISATAVFELAGRRPITEGHGLYDHRSAALLRAKRARAAMSASYPGRSKAERCTQGFAAARGGRFGPWITAIRRRARVPS